MSYRSGHQSEYRQHHESRPASRPPTGQPPATSRATRPDRLHAGSCGQAGPLRTRRVLDRGRHRHDAWNVVGGHRHLFRVSRRRSDAADRAPGGNAICLRRPDRGSSRQGRPRNQPAIAGSGAIRPEARTDHAAADHAGIARERARRHSRCDGLDQGAVARRGCDRTGGIRYPKALADQRHRRIRCAA